MGEGHTALCQCAQQSGLGYAAGFDEPELYDSDRSVVEGFMSLRPSAIGCFRPQAALRGVYENGDDSYGWATLSLSSKLTRLTSFIKNAAIELGL